MSAPTRLATLALLLTASAADALSLCNPFDPQTLGEYESSLAEAHPAFPHLAPEALAGRTTPVLLLDVREPQEYALSHLAGAINVAPDASVDELRRLLAGLRGTPAETAEVVFYCSVGYRSSKLAERARSGLARDGYTRIANLKGGIFAWSNRGMPVVDARGPTRSIHPYNDCFAPLLKPVLR